MQDSLENMIELHEWAHAFRTEAEINSPEDTLWTAAAGPQALAEVGYVLA